MNTPSTVADTLDAGDGWITHDGGPMPVSGETMVLTKRGKSGMPDVHSTRADWWDDEDPQSSNWSCRQLHVRITAYRVVQP